MALIIYYIIIFIAIILLIFKREWLLYYFVFLYPILPEYLSVSFSDSLPLFTASRLLLIVLMCSLIMEYKIKICRIRNKHFQRVLFFYVICEGCVCLAHISDIDSIKTFIGIVLENFIFIYVLYTLINSREKFLKCLNALVAQAGFVFFMGVLEGITKINIPMLILNTNSRGNILISVYERYNSIRATFTFGHSIALGVYCIAMIPLIMYKISVSKKKIYYILFEVGLGCMLMTMARGVAVVFFAVFILSMILMSKKERLGYFKIIGVTIFVAGITVVSIPSVFEVAKKTILASLNAFGANFDIGNTGGNENALLSRFSQFTILPQVLLKNPLFGGGTGFITKNEVYVYLENERFRAVSIDMEYLSMLINRGIFGLVAGVTLYYNVLKMTFKRMIHRHDALSKAFFLSFLSIFLAYFTVAQLTTGNILWLLIGMYLCYDNLFLYNK